MATVSHPFQSELWKNNSMLKKNISRLIETGAYAAIPEREMMIKEQFARILDKSSYRHIIYSYAETKTNATPCAENALFHSEYD